MEGRATIQKTGVMDRLKPHEVQRSEVPNPAFGEEKSNAPVHAAV